MLGIFAQANSTERDKSCKFARRYTSTMPSIEQKRLENMRLPKLDTIIIGVFFVCIALWMVSKCGNRRSDYLKRTAGSDVEADERPVRRDTVRVPATTTPAAQPAPTPVTATPTPQPVAATPQPSAQPTARTLAPTNPGQVRTAAPATTTPATATAPATTSTAPKQTMLFVTIDQLKIRKEPGLKSKTIGQLDLYEQVYFTGKRTDWTQEISLGYEKVTDRWVKIRTKDGKEGWVFGAGVNYYKEKRKGVID
jgi:hypothetical protein